MPDLIFSAFWDEVILWRNPISERDILWWHNKLTDSEITSISGIIDIRDYEKFDDYSSDHTGNIISNERIIEIIHNMRLIKNPDEIKKIEEAAKVSKLAFESIEKIIQPDMYEYEIEAEFARVLRAHHMTEAYSTIVASGPNSCVLHYTNHKRKLQAWDIVLIDAGAEYLGYASDLTRTFVVGKWNQRQKSIYDAVSRVKGYAESVACPWILFSEYEKNVRDNMNEELTSLGLIPMGISEDEKMILSKKYFPHRVSHFLGLDVHDVGPRDIEFQSGMVITIEPGIYIQEESIWIRLEDDYLILKNWVKKLS